MLTANQTLDMKPIGMLFHIVKTPTDTNGRALEMKWQLMPNGGDTPLHIHSSADESYRVLEGQLEINIGGKWQMLRSGEEATVTAGTPHTFRNPINAVTRVYNTHSPAMKFDEYFEALCSTVNKLSGGDKEKLKMSLNVATHLSMLMKNTQKKLFLRTHRTL